MKINKESISTYMLLHNKYLTTLDLKNNYYYAIYECKHGEIETSNINRIYKHGDSSLLSRIVTG